MGVVFSCLGDSRHPPPQNSNRSQSRNECYLNVHITLSKQQNETLHRREVQVVPEILGACSSGSANRVKPSAPDIMESEFFQKLSEVVEEEDVCPTCLEDYNPENPKIVTKCSHHFHLACIYEWMERSQECPVCFRVMEFDETA